jgi:hypothetical protein
LDGESVKDEECFMVVPEEKKKEKRTLHGRKQILVISKDKAMKMHRKLGHCSLKVLKRLFVHRSLIFNAYLVHFSSPSRLIGKK